MNLAVIGNVFHLFGALFKDVIPIIIGPFCRHFFFNRPGVKGDFFDTVSQITGIGNLDPLRLCFRNGSRCLLRFVLRRLIQSLKIENLPFFMPLTQGMGGILQAFDGFSGNTGRFLAGLVGHDGDRLRN